jgi:GT2 family glycosyltransferase
MEFKSDRQPRRTQNWRRVYQTAVRLWGSPAQFGAMSAKAAHVLWSEGPHRLIYYARKKLQQPYLRYNEVERPPTAEEDSVGYQKWLSRRSTELAQSHLAHPVFDYSPLISILTPVYNTDPKWLYHAVRSVLRQTYRHWELILTDDGSTCSLTRDVLTELRSLDSRITVLVHPHNRGISAASNTCLAAAQGEFIALLDHDDELDDYALARVVDELNAHRDADIIYSDEDKIGPDGTFYSPFFKPDWSPSLLWYMNYVSHLGVYRTALVREIGGFRSAFDGAQDYDVVLRAAESTSSIYHIPDVLYHWRATTESTALSVSVKPYALTAGRKAVEEHLERLRIPAVVDKTRSGRGHRIRFRPSQYPAVRVIIPTRDHVSYLKTCLSGVEAAEYPGDVRVTIVDNGSRQPDTVKFLQTCRHTVISAPGAFNFSSLVNRAAAQVQEDLLLLLNNDVEMVNPLWLRALVEVLLLPGVGVVGPHLIYPDGSTQHAGIIMSVGGTAGHAFWRYAADSYAYYGLQQTVREVTAVTGACLLTSTSLFRRLGGFPDELPHSFNDIAFCLEVQRHGLRVLYVPDAVLIHHESVSRDPRVEPWEATRFLTKWQPPKPDPYYSPHLSTSPSATYTLALTNDQSLPSCDTVTRDR